VLLSPGPFAASGGVFALELESTGITASLFGLLPLVGVPAVEPPAVGACVPGCVALEEPFVADVVGPFAAVAGGFAAAELSLPALPAGCELVSLLAPPKVFFIPAVSQSSPSFRQRKYPRPNANSKAITIKTNLPTPPFGSSSSSSR
jgi:hypothetical protein